MKMKNRHRSNAVVRFAFGIIIIFLIASVVNMQFQLKELKEKRVALEEKKQDVEDSIQELNMRLNTPLSDEYIEKVAREKFGYRKPNERIYVNPIAH